MIQHLIAGIDRYQKNVHPQRAAEFEKLAGGQKPWALFVTCSDSRVNPNLLTQTQPGELFIIRNAGNIVPPFPTPGCSEGGTLEFAIEGLAIPHIIVCGHSDCGAMKASLAPDQAAGMPSLQQWLETSIDSAAEIQADQALTDPIDRLAALTEKNVLSQLAHLKTYRCVAQGIEKGTLQLHGWVYDFAKGEVRAFKDNARGFIPLAEAYPKDA